MLLSPEQDLLVGGSVHSDMGNQRPGLHRHSNADILNVFKILKSGIDEVEDVQGYGLICRFLTWRFFADQAKLLCNDWSILLHKRFLGIYTVSRWDSKFSKTQSSHQSI